MENNDWRSNTEEIILMYKTGIGSPTIARKFGVNPETIRLMLRKMNINKPITKLSVLSQKLDYIKQQYESGRSCKNIATEFNASDSTLKTFLKRHNIKLRQIKYHKIDDSYFEKIDTKEKAYWLGRMYADGTMSKYSFELNIKYTDKQQLCDFKTALKSDHLISDLDLDKRACDYCEKGRRRSPQSVLRVHSVKMVNDLIKLGCMLRKSNRITFPSSNIVPEKLLPDFVLGYFDGDGISSHNIHHIGFLSNYEFCVKLQKWLMEKCNLDATKISPKKGNVFHVSYGGRFQVSKIYHLLYDNCVSVCLKRRKDIYDKFVLPLNKIPNKKPCHRLSKEDKQLIIKMTKNSESLHQMAKHFDVKESIIVYHLNRMGIPHTFTKMPVEESKCLSVIKDYQNNLSFRLITSRNKISDSVIFWILNKYDIPRRKPRHQFNN